MSEVPLYRGSEVPLYMYRDIWVTRLQNLRIRTGFGASMLLI